MKEIPVAQARPKLSELVGKVARGKRYVIAQQGKRGAEKAVLVGLDEFEGMRRQMEFRQVFQDIRTQARASLEIRESLDDDAAMEAADRLVQEFRRERRARRS
jgi:prevent-host-death family protein